MANSGIKSSQAGTSLRSIITRLSTDAGASSKSLGALGTLTEELGVQFYNTDGTARALGDVLADTREKWKGLNDEEQTAYAKKIAGQEAISGWLALMNAAPADVEKLSGAIRECDGAATDMSTTMIDNLQGDMTIFESAVDGMKISLSKEMTPVLRETVQYATKNIPKVESVLSGVFKTGMTGINFVVKHLPEIGSAVKAVTPIITGSLSAIAAYKVFTKIEKGIDTVKKLNDAIKAGEGVMKTLNATMGLSPVGAVAAGVGILTGAVVALKLAHQQLVTDGFNLWLQVSIPQITYDVQLAALKNDPRYADFVELQNYRYGDTGTVYCPELDISTEQRITEVEKNELNGDITRMVLGTLRKVVTRPDYMGSTISTGRSVEDKMNRANQNAIMSQSIAGMEQFVITALEQRNINILEGR